MEKEDTYNINETLVPSNQFKTEISNNYDWDEDGDDIFASISTQEILHQDVEMNNSFSINNFSHTSKFPVNKQITQGNQRDKSLVLRETNVALGLQKASGERPELRVGKDAVGVSEISIENESEEVKRKVNRVEVGKVNNPESSLVSAGFQTANGKKISISRNELSN
ncbi:uncharacterized protein ACN2A1_010273 [Glossina fuscipes fuscipes]